MPAEFIIHDTTSPHLWLPPEGESRGLVLPPSHERSYEGTADPFPDDMLIPESEWQARIKELEEREATIMHACDRAGLTVLDQNGTNYCWINAPVHCCEIRRVIANQTLVRLSPASCGGPIKGFRNNGGWGLEGLQYIANLGVVPQEKWPANAINRSYWTEENKALALHYRCTEWWALPDRSMKHVVSAILRGFPVALGYNWWSHEVTGVGLRWLDGGVVLVIDNSWGTGWGEKGRGILQGSRMIPDDAVVARAMVAA